MAQTRSTKKTTAKKTTAKKTTAKKVTTKHAAVSQARAANNAVKRKVEKAVGKAAPAKTKVKAPQPANVVAHPHNQVVRELRAFGLTYPEAHLKSPWPEHLDLAVRDKTFAYLSVEGEPLRLSCKLPQSCQAALDLEFTEPTGYGLGKSGWVTAKFKDGDEPPVEFLKTWLDESYRAQAPKSLSKMLPKMTSD